MKVETFFFKPTAAVPNSKLPVLIYRDIISGSPKEFEAKLRANGWVPDWYSNMGLYPKHHFHSDAHELIGFTSGAQSGVLGGAGGMEVSLKEGDVVVLPAGVAHLGLAVSEDLRAVGAYPMGFGVHDFRLCDEAEFSAALESVLRVPLPPMDPFYGVTGPLPKLWSKPPV
ncbi:cupin [Mesorhizobium sp. M1380]|uniref:cupin n=1 Tax=Mesorhizobium sp. M1380 TaxID=2957093 RepID=UPI00333BBDDC